MVNSIYPGYLSRNPNLQVRMVLSCIVWRPCHPEDALGLMGGWSVLTVTSMLTMAPLRGGPPTHLERSWFSRSRCRTILCIRLNLLVDHTARPLLELFLH